MPRGAALPHPDAAPDDHGRQPQQAGLRHPARAALASAGAAAGARAAAALGRWLGSRCRICCGWAPGPLCGDCCARFAPAQARCARCARPLAQPAPACGACLSAPPAWACAVVMADYAFPWDHLIGALKFHQQTGLARPLATMLAEAVGNHPAAGQVAWLLPVPLSSGRLAERGYNQAWLLARRLGRTLGLPARDQWLRRWRETPHQVGLGRAARLANLRDSFWVPPHAARALAGCRVALVDDVLTTGETAGEASRTLLAAGAAAVEVWALARTADPHG